MPIFIIFYKKAVASIITLIMIEQFNKLSISSQDYLMSQLSDSQLPHELISLPGIKKLDSILLNNFKSFKRSYIGPFLNFTSLIGPNGSGKSNVLEALMFCFCGQNNRHNFFDIREFINRNDKKSFKEMKKQDIICSVQANFILENQKILTLCRQLDAEGQERYLIDSFELPRKVYENFLIRKGINCMTPNYAIWQGEVQKLIMKDPHQLTTHFEHLSGSIMFKRQYDELEEALDDVRKNIDEKTQRINKLKSEKKVLKGLKQTSTQYQKAEKQYEQLLNKLILAKSLCLETSLDKLKQQIEKKKDQQEQKIKEIQEKKIKAQRQQKQKIELQKQMQALMKEINEVHAHLKTHNQPNILLKQQYYEDIKQQIKNNQTYLESLLARRQNLEKSMPQVHSNDVIKQYLAIYSQWQTENIELNKQIKRKQGQLFYIQGLIQSKQSLINQYKGKGQKIRQKKRKNQEQLKKVLSNVQEITNKLNKMKIQLNRAGQEMVKGKQIIKKKAQALSQIVNQVNDLQSKLLENVQNQKQREFIKKLITIDGFKGLLQQNIKPTNQKYQVCFGLMFNNFNKYLLCESQQSSRKIAQKLKDMNCLKTVAILNNVKQKKDTEMRKLLDKSITLASDIVYYDRSIRGLQNFIKELLWGKVICDNLTAGYKIREKNIPGIKQIYTLDGNILKNDGVICTYGNIASLKKEYKFNNNKGLLEETLHKLNKKKLQLQIQLNQAKSKYGQQDIIKRNLELGKLQRKKQDLENVIDNIKKQNQVKQPKSPKGLEDQLQALKQKRQKINSAIVSIQSMMQKSTHFQQFTKKHNIANLEAFRSANNVQNLEENMKRKNIVAKEIKELSDEIKQIKVNLQRQHQKSSKLQQQLNKFSKLQSRRQLQQQLQQKQKHLLKVRDKISKLGIYKQQDMMHKSDIPRLQQQLKYFKEKQQRQMEKLCDQLGVEVPKHYDYKELEQFLSIPLERLTRTKIQNLVTELQEQKVKAQEAFEKYNTLQIISNAKQNQTKIEDQLKQLNGQLDQFLEKRKGLVSKFQDISNDRKSLFLSLVQKIRPILSQTYRTLTMTSDGFGGTADVYMENQSIPFTHGLYYSPTPPTKRFVYDLQQLSGGEKSIACLALQYSISLATKAPFLILDETDAFLDSMNVDKFHNLITNSLKNSQLQFILITHKQGLYGNSQSLVGITKPKRTNVSLAYSLKLDDN